MTIEFATLTIEPARPHQWVLTTIPRCVDVLLVGVENPAEMRSFLVYVGKRFRLDLKSECGKLGFVATCLRNFTAWGRCCDERVRQFRISTSDTAAGSERQARERSESHRSDLRDRRNGTGARPTAPADNFRLLPQRRTQGGAG